jgi:hypothetical protein
MFELLHTYIKSLGIDSLDVMPVSDAEKLFSHLIQEMLAKKISLQQLGLVVSEWYLFAHYYKFVSVANPALGWLMDSAMELSAYSSAQMTETMNHLRQFVADRQLYYDWWEKNFSKSVKVHNE